MPVTFGRSRLAKLGFLTAVLVTPNADPGGVLARAQAAIVARVGDVFFHKYIGYLSATTYPPDERCTNCAEYIRKGYSLVTYRLRIPELPFVDELLECVIDSDGKVSRLAAPKCVNDPRECTFPYDEAAAQVIARAAGLQPGLKPWSVSFTWNYGLETFVWGVSNVLHEGKYGGSGQNVMIDANDGRVIGVHSWQDLS